MVLQHFCLYLNSTIPCTFNRSYSMVLKHGPSPKLWKIELLPLMPPTYSADFLHGPRYQCWYTSPSRLSTAAVAAHPNKMAPFLWACGMDGWLAWPVQGLTYVNSRVTQGLEVPPRTSASHLASDPGSRPLAAQSWPELSMASRPLQRMLEAARGNGYAPVRGTPTPHDDDDEIIYTSSWFF